MDAWAKHIVQHLIECYQNREIGIDDKLYWAMSYEWNMEVRRAADMYCVNTTGPADVLMGISVYVDTKFDLPEIRRQDTVYPADNGSYVSVDGNTWHAVIQDEIVLSHIQSGHFDHAQAVEYLANLHVPLSFHLSYETQSPYEIVKKYNLNQSWKPPKKLWQASDYLLNGV